MPGRNHTRARTSSDRLFLTRTSWIRLSGKPVPVKLIVSGALLRLLLRKGNRIAFLQFLAAELQRTRRLPEHPAYTKQQVVLQRAPENPIIRPYGGSGWESDAVFNAGALYLDDKVHLVYRAIGSSGLSVFGYASSGNGTRISERSPEPSFVCGKLKITGTKDLPRYPYSSGGSWWGSEDPRLTRIDDTIYMTYTAFDGHQPPCVALTSIHTDDFLQRKWKWNEPQLISEPGAAHKNWVIFPEKINGKFAVLHSITPQIQIAYRDSLDFSDGNCIRSSYYSKGREQCWDNWIRGVGPPPLKTSEGWLLLYHAMDRNDPGRYKIGAMLLDAKQPENILHRSAFPLLEPDHWYENEGHKRGVVYCCGAVVIGDQLFVYYGGADSFLCAASIALNTLLSQLKQNETIILQA